MKLEFESVEKIQGEKNTNLLHFWDNQVQKFYIENGKIMSEITRMEMGEWENLDFVRKKELIPTENVTFLNIENVFENMVVGTYLDNGVQKMIVYEY